MCRAQPGSFALPKLGTTHVLTLRIHLILLTAGYIQGFRSYTRLERGQDGLAADKEDP
jgi:hypothetical protein